MTILGDLKGGHSLEEFPRKKTLFRPQIRVTHLRVVFSTWHYNFYKRTIYFKSWSHFFKMDQRNAPVTHQDLGVGRSSGPRFPRQWPQKNVCTLWCPMVGTGFWLTVPSVSIPLMAHRKGVRKISNRALFFRINITFRQYIKPQQMSQPESVILIIAMFQSSILSIFSRIGQVNRISRFHQSVD